MFLVKLKQWLNCHIKTLIQIRFKFKLKNTPSFFVSLLFLQVYLSLRSWLLVLISVVLPVSILILMPVGMKTTANSLFKFTESVAAPAHSPLMICFYQEK